MPEVRDVNAPKTFDIDLRMSGPGLVSGILSVVTTGLSWWAAAMTEASMFLAALVFAPGALFGFAVMIPFRRVLAYWWPRAIGAALICVLAYGVAMSFVSVRSGPSWFGSLALAGAVGALIAGKGLLVLIGYPWRYRVLAAMVLIGALLGPLFGFILYLAYIPWQALTAIPLGALLKEAEAAHAPSPGRPAEGATMDVGARSFIEE